MNGKVYVGGIMKLTHMLNVDKSLYYLKHHRISEVRLFPLRKVT
jgi:hypothetical protein